MIVGTRAPAVCRPAATVMSAAPDAATAAAAPSASGHRDALPLEQPHARLEGSLNLCRRRPPVQRRSSNPQWTPVRSPAQPSRCPRARTLQPVM